MELYRGVISHRRWAPVGHGFAYEIFLALVDVTTPAAAAASVRGLWPLCAFNAPALASLHEADHLKGVRAPGQPLAGIVWCRGGGT